MHSKLWAVTAALSTLVLSGCLYTEPTSGPTAQISSRTVSLSIYRNPQTCAGGIDELSVLSGFGLQSTKKIPAGKLITIRTDNSDLPNNSLKCPMATFSFYPQVGNHYVVRYSVRNKANYNCVLSLLNATKGNLLTPFYPRAIAPLSQNCTDRVGHIKARTSVVVGSY